MSVNSIQDSGMIYSRARRIYLDVKVWLYRKAFSLAGVRFTYRLIKGRELAKYRDKLIHSMHYPQSVSNAGILCEEGGFLSVVKNQTFSFFKEIGISLPSNTLPGSQEDLKRLYRVDFDSDWSVKKLNKIQATIDGLIVGDNAGLEDARLFRYKGEVWMYATLSGHTKQCWPCIGRLHNNEVTLVRPKYDVESPQKNWMPFEANGNLYLEYSVNPHIVLSYDPESAECTLVGNTSCRENVPALQMHGGAPAIWCDSGHFLGLANTQEYFWYQKRYYAALFYLFEATPPFRVTHISRPIRIGSYKERIRYVAGMSMLSNRCSLIISIGIGDCDNCIVELKLSDIWKELESVTE